VLAKVNGIEISSYANVCRLLAHGDSWGGAGDYLFHIVSP